MNDLLGAYRGERFGERLHVWARARSCPFAAVAGVTPQRGRILDLGCGHGLFSLMLARVSSRSVLGVDVDRHKVEIARRASVRAGAVNARFDAVGPYLEPTPGWDAIALIDVLYLLGREPARQLVRRAAAALNPGGVLLVKEIDVVPRWKFELARYQELAATRLVRITQGRNVDFLPPNEIGAEMETSGLSVQHVPLQRHRLHPHHLVVGTAG